MDCLGENVILRVLNLSWNLIVPTSEQNSVSNLIYPRRGEKQFNEREDWEMTHAEIMASRFSKLIRFNNTL